MVKRVAGGENILFPNVTTTGRY